MATVSIKVPSVGESISEGILARWLKPDGSVVKVGDPLFELETDKASNVVNATSGGVLSIKIAEGATVEVGSEVGAIDTSASPAQAKSEEPKPAPVVAAAASARNGSDQAAEPALSPATRRVVAEEHVDPSAVKASGPGGRLTKGDVLAHLSARSDLPDAPATKAPIEPAAPVVPLPAQNAYPGNRETRKRMSGIRQKIAQRLVEAQHTAAILTTFNEADMTKIAELRAKYKDSFKTKHGVSLGFSSFFIKAAVEALKAFRAVNARVEGSDIVYHNVYDVGVAVSTERGLMVPVVKNADKMTFADLEKAVAAYAVKAREGNIAVSDLQGGTFTITNGGVFGSLLSTPILNPPQSGILGMHAIQKRPVVVDDQIVIRPMMYLALSYDHRIVDGREAVSFLVRIKECIENPDRLLLEV